MPERRGRLSQTGHAEQILKCGGRSHLFNWGEGTDSKNG